MEEIPFNDTKSPYFMVGLIPPHPHKFIIVGEFYIQITILYSMVGLILYYYIIFI
jgi:hypothetical protein